MPLPVESRWLWPFSRFVPGLPALPSNHQAPHQHEGPNLPQRLEHGVVSQRIHQGATGFVLLHDRAFESVVRTTMNGVHGVVSTWLESDRKAGDR